MPTFVSGSAVPQIKSYMDDFPFPFYVILRQIAALPAIIGEALLQWFEVIIAES